MVDTLNWKGLATAAGIMWGVYLGAAALFAQAGVTTMWFSPETFSWLMTIYPGLAPGLVGAVIGLFWGALCGAICGGIFGWLYNWSCKKWWR